MNEEPSITFDHKDLPDDPGAAVEILWKQNQELFQQVRAMRVELDRINAASKRIFHPLGVLLISLASGLAFSGLVILDQELQGDRHFFFLYYMVPVSVPFVAFLFDRLRRWEELAPHAFLVDLPVIGLAMTRSLTTLPGISGHALFLTYALLTSRSPAVTITAGLVLLQVAYLKILVWRDPTLFGGIFVALFAAGVLFLLRRLFVNKKVE